MSFCPKCSMDGYFERTYSPEHDEDSVKVYHSCRYCGYETEGEWFSIDELEYMQGKRTSEPEVDLGQSSPKKTVPANDDEIPF